MKKLKLSLLAIVIGIFMMPIVASATLSDYSFYLNVSNLGTSYTGPFVKVDVDYTSNDAATLTFSSYNDGTYTYKFNEIGLNLSGTTTVNAVNGYTISYATNDHQYKFDGFKDLYKTDILKNGSQGFSNSVSSLVLTVSGLGGNSVFATGVEPVAAHIYAWDGISSDAKITGYATGHAPVPIPAAAWLLGSGVLGMIGLRRKKSA